MMTLYLTRKAGTEPILLSLPATPADIGNAFAELDAICQDPSATEIYKVDSEVRNLSRYICNVNVEDSENLRKLNQLAELLQRMSREDQMKMEGVLDSNSINGIDDILNAMEREMNSGYDQKIRENLRQLTKQYLDGFMESLGE